MIRQLFPLVIMAVLLFIAGPLGAAHWITPKDFEEAQIEAEAAAHEPRQVEIDDPVTLDIVPMAVDIKEAAAGIDGNGKGTAAVGVSIDRAMADLKARTVDQSIVIDLSSDVLFDFDKSDIKPAAAATLDKVAVIIKTKSAGKVLIEGHTDAKGSEAYNQKLSERRSAMVKKWLIDHYHFSPDQLVTKGWGETRPVAPNTRKDGSDNPEGRARNRRVVITIPIVKQ